MTILLGATFALLLTAVVLSFSQMKEGERNAPADEIARLRNQLDQLKIEQDRLETEKKIQQMRANPTPSVKDETDSEIAAMKAQLDAIEAEKEALKEEKDLAEKKADTYRDEAGFIGQRDLEKSDSELRRARLIRDALLIGRISEYVSDPEFGGFVTLEIVLPEHVQQGTILAIRRNTGILGRVQVTEISMDGAIASPMPGFGPIEPQAGDELIIPPQV
ncbi:hypothetical protein [Luteolibacter sp. AS25]|uniref:hypothetical protein n=1 Tax=Luteolibacter sp. AS25 TaxID=3135776 RepID=UPI00398ABC99